MIRSANLGSTDGSGGVANVCWLITSQVFLRAVNLNETSSAIFIAAATSESRDERSCLRVPCIGGNMLPLGLALIALGRPWSAAARKSSGSLDWTCAGLV